MKMLYLFLLAKAKPIANKKAEITELGIPLPANEAAKNKSDEKKTAADIGALQRETPQVKFLSRK